LGINLSLRGYATAPEVFQKKKLWELLEQNKTKGEKESIAFKVVFKLCFMLSCVAAV